MERAPICKTKRTVKGGLGQARGGGVDNQIREKRALSLLHAAASKCW